VIHESGGEMSHSLINLTLPIVLKAIDNTLDRYPEDPYQLAHAIHEMRQKLVAHVLSYIPNRYAVEGMLDDSSRPESLYASPSEKQIHTQLQRVVHESIPYVLRENADWLGCDVPPIDTENETVIYQSYRGRVIHST
jgi:hypothetical protein